MLRILSEDRAKTELLMKLGQQEAAGLISPSMDGMMFGCLIVRLPDGSTRPLFAFSGAFDGRYLVDGFVPPFFSVNAFNAIVNQYDSAIHCYTDRIERGEKELSAMRRALSNDCLREIRENYRFFSPQGPVTFSDMNLSSVPTGTGDCAAAKLLSYCFRRGWEPVSLCELFYGRAEGRRHLESCTPCDEKCALILPYIFGLDIVYADDWLVIVNKKEGMLSVPGKGEGKEDCVTERIRKIFPSAPANPTVHRLDMDTSGLLIVARNAEAQAFLQRQFEQRSVRKKYTALLDGLVKEEEGLIDLPIRLDEDNRPKQTADPVNGKKAVTGFRRLSVEMIDGRPATRMEFTPHTGRTHQIRVHAAYALGCPIIGDRLYGTRKPGQRLCLHASQLSFIHPQTKEYVTFDSKCPF